MTILQVPFFQEQPFGSTTFTTTGTSTFTVPDDVYFISAVLIGGGASGARGGANTEQAGSGGGGLRYINYLPVIPGETLSVVVGSGGVSRTANGTQGQNGGSSQILRGANVLVEAGGGVAAALGSGGAVTGGAGGTGTSLGTGPFGGIVGGGNGGKGGDTTGSGTSGAADNGGGGGAGGYSGNGGAGVNGLGTFSTSTNGGSGGGAAGGLNSASVGGAGGGVGLLGENSSGSTASSAGSNGVDGTPAGTVGSGGLYGGGGGGSDNTNSQAGGDGAVRIMWGPNKHYPSTNVVEYSTAYEIITGTSLPTYGVGGGDYPPGGWTGIQNSSVDDASTALISFPFTWTISSVSYNGCYVGSNTYVTFGSGSNVYNSLSASNPALDKIFIGAADNSYQRVSHFTSGTDYVRIRYEGTAGTTGTVGSPNIVYEITFFNPSLFGGNNVCEILVGNHNRTTGQFGIASTSTYYASGTISSNQSYVFQGNSTGTSWTISVGSYVSY